MATSFGSYKNSSSPYMSWYAEYSYSRTSNSNVSVTVTVHGEILNHSSTSYMGTGNNIVVTGTVAGQSKTYEIKSSSAAWVGNSNNPRSCSFSFDVASGAAGQSISVSYSVAGSGYTAPATVPTQSTSFSSPALLYTKSNVLAAGDGQQTINVTITRQSDQMTHSVTYSYGGHSVTHTDVATTDSYKIPNNWVTDRTVARIDISCETFINGTSLGSSYDYGTYNSPADLVPSITQSYHIVNPALEKIIKGLSSIKFASTAQGIDGSTISESYITYGNNSIPLDGSTGILETAGYITFTQFCKDSRGRTATKVLELSVTDYERPHVTITSLNIVENKIAANIEYSWYNITGNSASIELLYRMDGDSEYTSAYSETLANNDGTLNIQPSAEFLTDQNYEIVVRISDKISSYDATQEIISVDPIIDVYESDTDVKSVGIGGVAKEDGKTTIYNPLTCLEPAQLSGGQWVHRAWGTSGTQSYVKFAELTVTNGYPNMGVSIDIIQRTIVYPSRLSVMFDGSTADTATLVAFEVYGWKTNYWIKKESTSVWGLYAYKVELYDEIDIVGFTKPPYPSLNVTWVDEAVDNIDGATAATSSNMHINVDKADTADTLSVPFVSGATEEGTTDTLMDYFRWKPSSIGTYYSSASNTWYNVLSCRHRNGQSDGSSYGLLLYNALFGGDLMWYQQTGENSYGADRTLWDSGNSLQTAAGGGNDSAYIRIGNFQICWGAFSVTIDVSTATGSSYYGEWSGDVSFAQPFASSCYPNISLTSESTFIKSIELEQRSSTGIQKILAFDSRPRTSFQFYVHYIACGFWG